MSSVLWTATVKLLGIVPKIHDWRCKGPLPRAVANTALMHFSLMCPRGCGRKNALNALHKERESFPFSTSVYPIPTPSLSPTSPRPQSLAAKQKFHRWLPATHVYAFGKKAWSASVPGPTIMAATNVTVTVKWSNSITDTSHLLTVDTTLGAPDITTNGVPFGESSSDWQFGTRARELQDEAMKARFLWHQMASFICRCTCVLYEWRIRNEWAASEHRHGKLPLVTTLGPRSWLHSRGSSHAT